MNAPEAPLNLSQTKSESSKLLYLGCSALFVAALITTNLIANKFVTVNLGFKTFQISAGILPYPITFLITDILSEFYGKKRTQHVVILGFIVSLFVLGVLWLGHFFPAISQSPVSNETYDTVFANSYRVVGSSMLAYLAAQFVDVRVYHFWKRLTNGRHLWLRNNGSTVISQFVDTTLVVTVLLYDTLPPEDLLILIIDGWIFKSLVAAFDTPVMYLVTYSLRTYFGMRVNQELPT